MKSQPIIGIYARRSNKGTNPERPFKGLTGVFTRLQEAAARNDAVAYVFTPEDVDFTNSVIQGHTVSEGEWSVQEFPLPNSIYDRGFFIKPTNDEKNVARQFRKDVRERGIPYLVSRKIPPIVNKKLGFAELMHRKGIPHPATREYSKSSVVEMLENHDSLYIKPDDGAMGIGIITATRQGTDWFTLGYKRRISGKKFEPILQDVGISDVSMAITLIRHDLGTDERGYIVQEAVPIYEHEGKQTDVRVVMQRDGHGILGVTSVFVRVGGNYSQGGKLVVSEVVLEGIAHQTGQSPSTIRDETEDISKKCFIAVEEESGVEAADLGLDIVYTEQGLHVVIEANIKQGDLLTGLLKEVKGTSLEARVREERDAFFNKTIQFGVRQVEALQATYQ